MVLRYAQSVVDISTARESYQGVLVGRGIGETVAKFFEQFGLEVGEGRTLDVRLNLDDQTRQRVIILVTDREDE